MAGRGRAWRQGGRPSASHNLCLYLDTYFAFRACCLLPHLCHLPSAPAPPPRAAAAAPCSAPCLSMPRCAVLGCSMQLQQLQLAAPPPPLAQAWGPVEIRDADGRWHAVADALDAPDSRLGLSALLGRREGLRLALPAARTAEDERLVRSVHLHQARVLKARYHGVFALYPCIRQLANLRECRIVKP